MKKPVKRGKSKSASKRGAGKSKTAKSAKSKSAKSKTKKITKAKAARKEDQSPPRHDRNSRLWRRRRPPRQLSRAEWPLSMPPLAH